MTNTKSYRIIVQKSQFWLCDQFVPLTLTFVFHCFCFYNHALALPPGALSLCLKRLILPCPEVGHSARYLQDNSLYFLNRSLSLTYKRISSRPPWWLFWSISLPSSWSAGFLNKVLFLASTPCLSINWLVLWLADQTWTQQKYYIRFEIQKKTLWSI